MRRTCISRPASRWCSPRRTGSPIPRRCSRRWAADGGTAATSPPPASISRRTHRSDPSAGPKAMVNHPRVLVVDADPGICRLLRRHFGAANYTVTTAETGHEALDLIRRTPPDLAILSTELDDMAGTEVIRCV